jgi:DNA-binding NtrC family response regulator
MPVNVLIADDDLDVHELIHDILEINFKNVKIDRALTAESFLEKVTNAAPPFDLYIIDMHLNEGEEKDILSMVREQFPQMLTKIIIIAGSPEEVTGNESVKDIPYLVKPFSLDYFGDIVKKVYSA